jgi:NADPH2:quinone reductase
VRAVQVMEFGSPDAMELRDIPAPSPGADEVLVSMTVADVLFLDTMLRHGGPSIQFFPRTPPYTAGCGGVGTVAAVGEGVDPSWVGRRVVADTQLGSFAEQMIAPVGRIVPIPDGLDDRTAAALMHDGMTAMWMDGIGRPQAGEAVLVTAAAGGAASQLVRLAAAAGARVIAAASTPAKRDFAARAGAAVTIDYTRDGWADEVRAASDGGVALAYDATGGDLALAALSAVADGGRMVSYGTSNGFAQFDPEDLSARSITVTAPLTTSRPTDEERGRLIHDALIAGAEGRLQPSIGAVYPLARAAEAHRDLEERRLSGKALVSILD